MSRKDKSRRRIRKARRRERKTEDAHYRARNELPPRLRCTPNPGARPRDGTRWACLSLRGGLQLGFKGTGVRVPVDLDAPDAEHALTEALAYTIHPESGDA